MPQPGQTSARGDDWLVRKVQDLERKVQELSSANVFGLTGITPQDGGTNFDGYVNIGGPLTVNGSSTINGPQTVNGAQTVKGHIDVDGPSGGAFRTLRSDGTVTNQTNSSGFHSYDSSGTEVTTIDSTNGVVTVAGSQGSLLIDSGRSTGRTVSGLLFKSTISGTAQTLGAQIYSSQNQVTVQGPTTSNNGSSQSFATFSDSQAQITTKDTSGNGAANFLIKNDGVWQLSNWAGTSAVYTSSANSPVYVAGGLTVSGTKNFMMDHPTKPGWTLKHASTESPHNGVEYWGSGKLDANGEAKIDLPEYFEALTGPDLRNISLTPIGRGTSQPQADRIIAGSFKVYGGAGTEFDWRVKAVRVSVDPKAPIDFEVESQGTERPSAAAGV